MAGESFDRDVTNMHINNTIMGVLTDSCIGMLEKYYEMEPGWHD